MKKTSLNLKIFIVMLFMMISMMNLISHAASEEFLTIKENENNYLIYVKNVLNKEFQFAFSDKADNSNLSYISSAKDTKGNNVAYIDEALKTKFFANNNSAYLWVKTNEDVSVLEGVHIELTTAKTYAELSKINDMTKTITINADAESEKITIEGKSEDTHYYKMFSIGSSEEYQKFVDLVEKINEQDNNTDTYTKITSYIELNNLYDTLVPEIDDDSWIEAKNLQIEKPYDAKENQKYVLWLKDSKGTRDFQILTAYQKEVKSIEIKEKVVEVTSKLPVTYDNTSVLYIALAIVIIAIITMIIIRVRIENR